MPLRPEGGVLLRSYLWPPSEKHARRTRLRGEAAEIASYFCTVFYQFRQRMSMDREVFLPVKTAIFFGGICLKHPKNTQFFIELPNLSNPPPRDAGKAEDFGRKDSYFVIPVNAAAAQI